MHALPRSLALSAAAALFLAAGVLHGQETPDPPAPPAMEAVAGTVPALTVVPLDSVRLMRSAEGRCGRAVPMPRVPPGGDAVEMPRVPPSPRTLPMPTIRCEPGGGPGARRPTLRTDPVRIDTLAIPSVEGQEPP